MRIFLIILIGMFIHVNVVTKAFAYRPFVSTDAAVADPKEIELETGFLIKRADQFNTLVLPQSVINYGIIPRIELVGEFEIDKELGGSIDLLDPALSIKSVLKEGILQGHRGGSFAVESSLLIPSTAPDQRRIGFENVFIWSHKLSHFIYHLNFGGGVDRHETDGFFVWGGILENSITPTLRWVGEINGEAFAKESSEGSGLAGLIWVVKDNLSLDAAFRHRIFGNADQWQVTVGFTYGFSFISLTGRRDQSK